MWNNPLTVPLDIFSFSSRCIEPRRLFILICSGFLKCDNSSHSVSLPWRILALTIVWSIPACISFNQKTQNSPQTRSINMVRQSRLLPRQKITVTWKCEKFLELFSCFDFIQTSHIITRRYSCYNSKRFNGYNMKCFNSLL